MASVADICCVGKITYNRSRILGNGCDGTVVYQGFYGTIPVAVKRILSRNVSVISSEINTICRLGGHRNILKYFATEEDRVEYCFIAFELCAGTLVDCVKGNIDTGCCLDVDLLRQATEGLDYLHSLKIVHRDIKPQNILISPKEANDEVIVKIADFGFCKAMRDGHSVISMSDVRGTSGWIAPEVLKEGQEKVSSAIDVFALGCVFYYVLTKGEHPFGPGSGTLRMVQISKGKFNLQGVDPAAKSIIQKMIDSNPKNRPPLKTVLANTFLTKNTKDKSPSPTKSLTASPDFGSTTPRRERSKTTSILKAIRKRISSGSDSKEIEYSRIFAEGKVKFNIESVIEQGNFGICFFRGEFAGKSACIKRIPYTERAKNEFAASNEIRVLNSLGFHAHIVTLFTNWKDEKFYFLAMELHDETLEDFVSSRQKPSDAERLRILREAVQGIAYVHNRGFLYMKLEPTSFRLVTNSHSEVVVKLANFESCIEMGPQGAAQNFVSQNFEADFDWIAPEIVAEGKTSISHKADVFSMGCIFYYVLSGGRHPFGDETVARRKAIKSGFSNLTFKTLTTPYATNLVKQMIDFRPSRRPTCQEVLNSLLLSIPRKQNQNSSFTSN